MNPGITLVDLAHELERQIETRKDVVAKTTAIEMLPVGTEMRLRIGGVRSEFGMGLTKAEAGFPLLGITDHAHDQIAQYTDIPRAYYERMRTAEPGLLGQNVNTWLHTGKAATQQRLVRTLDERVRAFLSDIYRPLDNYDLASAILPLFQARGVKVISANLDEKRMYVKGILPDLSIGLDGLGWADSGGEAWVAAIIIGNSEVGSGSLSVDAGLFNTRCTNLTEWPRRDGTAATAMRKHHVGRAFGDLDGDFSEFFKDDTRAADDKALWLKVRDVMEAALDRDIFEARAKVMAQSRDDKIVSGDLPAVIDVTLRRFNLPDSLSARVQATIEDKYDLSRYGLSAALTDVSGRLKDYALSTELEKVGGEIITLDPKDWKVIAEAESDKDKPKRAPRGRRAAVVA